MIKKALTPISFFLFYFYSNLAFSQIQNTVDNKFYFYFCISRALDIELVNEIKQEILFTKITKLKVPKSETGPITKKWSDYTYANCKYEHCTSDVYYFKTQEKAIEKFEELVNLAAEKIEYKLVEINLE